MSERMEKLSSVNYWNELFVLRDKQREHLKTAIQCVRGADLPLENNSHGLMRWYMHPEITDTVLSTFLFFKQEIPPGSRSGMLYFQGGQVMYVLEGKGHTLLDGVKHAWEAGDVINLPVKTQGITVQHVNDDASKWVKFLVAEPNWFACTTVDRGVGFEQVEPSPDYNK
jgi:quercetin dioxygenase-like cupin family protein